MRESRITKSAGKAFAEALYMQIDIPTYKDSVGVTKGRTCVHLDIPGGPRVPIKLEIVDEFGDITVAGADAGLLLRGPGSLAAFIGRTHEKELLEGGTLVFAILDGRVIVDKSASLHGAFQAYGFTKVADVLEEFAVAVRHVSTRKPKEDKWQ